ncbi:hypothetical protein [Nocardioides perillae]|uniref:Uncharacterized protein n=1 Tax=Nocardioides perillae TaxID=1119534 RepID=A0A7Y9RRM4_9ACTN|nr:hypothetical protein [Nocardioides perillae]NYG55312.1 hypothetical protein [Nocardioides perillae]
MGLSDMVARAAARHAHVLVVETPGWWRTRAMVEREVLARGWSLAFAPADADVLVVCGKPGPQLAEAVELVWHQMPGPRVRVGVTEDDDVAPCLDGAHSRLLDTDHHMDDARQRPAASELLAEHSGMDHGGMDHGGMDHGGMDHGGMDHGGMDHGGMDHGGMDHGGMDHGGMDHGGMDHGGMDHGGGHGGMDHWGGHEGMDHGDGHEGMDHGGGHEGMDHGRHGDMDMSPSGIPLAQGGDDRDGLEMDVLDVRLGPVLPHWPAGLVLRCSLQGDVVTEARAELLDGEQPREAAAAPLARRLDNIASLLALAGWDDAAAEARSLRDVVLAPGDDPTVGRVARLRRRVRRSWTLRWSLRGVRPLSEDDVRQLGLPAHAGGDAYDRLIGMLDRAAAGDETASTGDAAGHTHDVDRTLSADLLAHLVTGLDLATARLVVASLDLDGLRAGHAEHEMSHG